MALQEEEEDTKGLWSLARFSSCLGSVCVCCRSKKEESQQQHPSETLEDPRSIHILQQEIAIEILSRVPVESLLRCKSVCKSWHSLISDPHFVKYHLSLCNKNKDYAQHRLVFCTWGTSVKWCSLHDVIYDKSINRLELDSPLKHPRKTGRIVGSCNGLLCIVIKDNDDQEQEQEQEDAIFIWNPSTRRSNRLPYSGFKGSLFTVYGFGYEESSNDYKVVSMPMFGGKNNRRVVIYSLKSGNWKRIGNFPNDTLVSPSPHFSNGALHWSSGIGWTSSWTIISLDLATKTYGEVLQPVYDEGCKNLSLKVLGEGLCVVCSYNNNKKLDIWVMKVYGVKDSWTKLASIQNLPGEFSTPGQFSVFLISANDGKILLRCGHNLILCDVKNGSFSVIKKKDGAFVEWVTVESLVSPDAPRDS